MNTLDVLFVVLLSAMIIMGVWGCYHAIKDILTHIRKDREMRRAEQVWMHNLERDRRLLEDWKALQLSKQETEK